jgi:hypothetical protein
VVPGGFALEQVVYEVGSQIGVALASFEEAFANTGPVFSLDLVDSHYATEAVVSVVLEDLALHELAL